MKIGINSLFVNENTHDGPKIFLRRLKDSIKKNNFAEVTNLFNPFYDYGILSVLDRNYLNKKYIIRVDGIYIDSFNYVGNGKKLNEIIFNKISRASGVVFISEFSKKLVEIFYNKNLQDNIVIHNKVSISEFSNLGESARKSLKLNKNDILLVTSAKWRRHKRLKETIKFLNILNQDQNRFKLLVIGKNEHFSNIENVYFTGQLSLSELPFWYRAADIYIHLCWIEACGNTQIEAMACGLPVLCCNNGGIGETIIRARGGIVSNADKKYEFNEIDLYNPPEPNYKILKDDLYRILNNYAFYKKNIDYSYLDIKSAAKQYVSFVKKLYEKKNNYTFSS